MFLALTSQASLENFPNVRRSGLANTQEWCHGGRSVVLGSDIPGLESQMTCSLMSYLVMGRWLDSLSFSFLAINMRTKGTHGTVKGVNRKELVLCVVWHKVGT